MPRRLCALFACVLSAASCSSHPLSSPDTASTASRTASRIEATDTTTASPSTSPVTPPPVTPAPTTTSTSTTTTTTVPITAPPPPVDLPAIATPPDGTPITSANNVWLGVEALYLDARGPATDCATFTAVISPDPYVYTDCGQWNGATVSLAWSVTQNTVADGFHVLLWHPIGPDEWEPVLKYVSLPGELAGVTAIAADADGVPGDELVIGFRHAGTNDLLDIDVLDASTGAMQVVAHIAGLAQGAAEVVPGTGVEIWTAALDPATGACCTATYQQSFLRPGWTFATGAVADTPTLNRETSQL